MLIKAVVLAIKLNVLAEGLHKFYFNFMAVIPLKMCSIAVFQV